MNENKDFFVNTPDPAKIVEALLNAEAWAQGRDVAYSVTAYPKTSESKSGCAKDAA